MQGLLLSIFRLLFFSFLILLGNIFLEIRWTYLLSLEVTIYSILSSLARGGSWLDLSLSHFLAYRKTEEAVCFSQRHLAPYKPNLSEISQPGLPLLWGSRDCAVTMPGFPRLSSLLWVKTASTQVFYYKLSGMKNNKLTPQFLWVRSLGSVELTLLVSLKLCWRYCPCWVFLKIYF